MGAEKLETPEFRARNNIPRIPGMESGITRNIPEIPVGRPEMMDSEIPESADAESTEGTKETLD
jgi:hypothetical protein